MAAGVAAVIAANTGRVEGRRPGHGPLFAAGGLVACVALYLAYNLSPYDFRLNQAFAERRLGQLLAVPFLGYYQNPEFKALRDLLLKMSMTLPIGFFLDRLLGFHDERARRLLTMAALLAAGLFFAAVEAGQALLPSRYPDNTDILLAVVGVWLGLRLSRPFARKADQRSIRE
jgi:glycopeptide antibiotics resistance protein